MSDASNPALTKQAFTEALRPCLATTSINIAAPALEALHQHAELLVRWNALTNLVGPWSTVEGLVRSHYAESALGMVLLEGCSCCIDIGSGAGFPGFVLAALRHPERCYLIEPRRKRADFLTLAATTAGLRNITVIDRELKRFKPDPGLLGGHPVIVQRATFPPHKLWAELHAARLSHLPVVTWTTSGDLVLHDEHAAPYARRTQELTVPWNDRHVIARYEPHSVGSGSP